MPEASRQPKDKNYNLISVLYHSSDNVESLKTYIQDAQVEGDQELVEFFNGILENNLTAVQRAKEMLVPRFQGESYGSCHTPQTSGMDQKDPARVVTKSCAPFSDPSACRPRSSTPLTHAGPWPGTPRAKPSSSPSGTTKKPTPHR